MPKRRISVIAAVLTVCILSGVLFSVRITAASAPTLFHNDEKWYKDSTATLEIIDDIPYIPIDIFGMYSHIELSLDSRRSEFMLYNRTTKQYISVLYNEKIATVNGTEEIYLNLYKLHGGYYYVPAEYFCSVLGFSAEIADSSAPSGKTFRLDDGKAKKTLAELLSPYAGSGTDTGESTPPVTTDPPVTDPPVVTGDDKTERTIYLTFNTIEEENTNSILKSLKNASMRATFFFTDAEIARYPSLVNNVFVGGHSLAITTDAFEDADDFIRQMNDLNERLYGITKTKTRLVQLPPDAAISPADAEKILAAGYVIWDYTYDVPDSKGYASYAVREHAVTAVRSAKTSVLRMSTNATVVKMLPDFLKILGTGVNYHIEPMNASGTEVRTAKKP